MGIREDIMKRLTAILLAALLFAALFAGCSAKKVYRKEANTGQNAGVYPYLVRMPSATWYLAKDDIELLGEGAFFEGLDEILETAEADLADARGVLKGFIPEDVPPVDIFTDFCNHAAESEKVFCYYNGTGNFIKLFHGWDEASAELQHEYVHYLTSSHLMEHSPKEGIWSEGVCEYVSKMVCRNRTSDRYYRNVSEADAEYAKETGVWNEEEQRIDQRRLYFVNASALLSGKGVGQPYLAVRQQVVVRTQSIQDNPHPSELSYCEAAGIFTYLVETFGQDVVFANLDLPADRIESVYGKPFSELYRDWAAWNGEQCKILGITVE